jgi:hypothetical protein
VEPSQGLVSAICEGTRELHLEATQVLGIASKHPGTDRNPVRRTSQTIANVYNGSKADIRERIRESALPPEAEMLIVDINVC